MRYFVETYGCTMNFGEGRELSEVMASLGYEPAADAEEADVVVLNTCTVVETTEKRMLSRISELRKQGKKVVVTGCMAQVQPKRISIRLPDSPIVRFEDYGRFGDIVEERYGRAGAPVRLETSADAILPIAQGCLGHCSYCITKFARGDLRSYPADTLLGRFDRFLEGGAKEILITAQDDILADQQTDLARRFGAEQLIYPGARHIFLSRPDGAPFRTRALIDIPTWLDKQA